ncbi:ABC transporter permease [Rhodococcus sp. 14C212]|uniref:ABC transporter permease n=1 Tax=Rhodococcus sp. 14C212 TaxID=2711209 RepID=UPI0013E9A801|nr:ABC transporter permease [Rhodococcus sp. 14C212]NGP05706.1 ABC transporter permease [Rhodococcus sp. 14C212]
MSRIAPSRILLSIWAIIVFVWIVAPIIVVTIVSFTSAGSFVFPPPGWSFQWYENFFENAKWYNAFLNSLQTACIVMVVATVLGTVAALGLHRSKSRRLAAGIQSVILLPTVVPAVVAGIGMYSMFLQWRISGTVLGFVLAHVVLVLPFVVISVTSSLQSLDRSLEQAAASCGAPPVTTFMLVTLRIILPGVATGALLAFLGSFNETLVSIFLASPFQTTLPVQMYSSVARDSDPTIAAASALASGVTVALFLAVVAVRITRSKKNAV